MRTGHPAHTALAGPASSSLSGKKMAASIPWQAASCLQLSALRSNPAVALMTGYNAGCALRISDPPPGA